MRLRSHSAPGLVEAAYEFVDKVVVNNCTYYTRPVSAASYACFAG